MSDANNDNAATCTVPPPGWTCSREPGHEGPCASLPVAHVIAIRPGQWWRHAASGWFYRIGEPKGPGFWSCGNYKADGTFDSGNGTMSEGVLRNCCVPCEPPDSAATKEKSVGQQPGACSPACVHLMEAAILSAQLIEAEEQVSTLEARIAELTDRIVTGADEAFGPFPVQTADEALTAIERGIFEMRQKAEAALRSRQPEAPDLGPAPQTSDDPPTR